MLKIIFGLLKGAGKIKGAVGLVKKVGKYATVLTATIDSFEAHYEKEFGKPFKIEKDVKVEEIK